MHHACDATAGAFCGGDGRCAFPSRAPGRMLRSARPEQRPDSVRCSPRSCPALPLVLCASMPAGHRVLPVFRPRRDTYRAWHLLCECCQSSACLSVAPPPVARFWCVMEAPAQPPEEPEPSAEARHLVAPSSVLSKRLLAISAVPVGNRITPEAPGACVTVWCMRL